MDNPGGQTDSGRPNQVTDPEIYPATNAKPKHPLLLLWVFALFSLSGGLIWFAVG